MLAQLVGLSASPVANRGVTGTVAPPSWTAYLSVAVHVCASSLHGWSHLHAEVPTTFVQNVFISVVVIAIPPLAAALIALRRWHLGYALLFSSMAGSFLFEIAFHFVVDTPDSVVNVCGTGVRMFLVSAVVLALVELVGSLDIDT
ncbi:hypothetical protein HAV22_03510 [Massilia sp. TW-1]|uniref:Uncharacterized protein n=1 Tax=Telluria antibiotica TaxID=2717319 RepID=A0ABX0P6V9_9BURK|nr:hypothetical protein [Telluria antibiotica]NIA52722.1 hypothetical protein [Telluria antibiotica]